MKKPPDLLIGLRVPPPPAALRRRSLEASAGTVAAPADWIHRLWTSRPLRRGWVATVALLLVANALAWPAAPGADPGTAVGLAERQRQVEEVLVALDERGGRSLPRSG